MKGPWIKLWRKAISDENLLIAIDDHGDKAFRVWFTLMARADDGVVSEKRRVLEKLCDAKPAKFQAILEDMADLGMVTIEGDKIILPGWSEYQDCDSKSRTKEWRDRHNRVTDPSPKSHQEPAVTDRALDGDGDGEAEHSESPPLKPQEPEDPDPFHAFALKISTQERKAYDPEALARTLMQDPKIRARFDDSQNSDKPAGRPDGWTPEAQEAWKREAEATKSLDPEARRQALLASAAAMPDNPFARDYLQDAQAG